MTDDIVTRLRKYLPHLDEYELTPLAYEAADEIERLRSRVDYWYERCLRGEECVQFLQNKKWWKR